ncbi:MAG TPA: hypothetical protein ENI91_04485 [Sphingomonadales bacterium]|nr:hypothetical protein [Sphingomonadales bacterium]
MKLTKLFVDIISCTVGSFSLVAAKGFEVGQVWMYETRDKDQGSTLTIVKIDNMKEGAIIHISIEDVNIHKFVSGEKFAESISHLPINEKSFRTSLIKLIGKTDKLPEYQEGYGIWKKEFNTGKAGVFDISVAQCVEYVEKTLN